MYLFQPMFKILLYCLLRPCNKCSLLLLMKSYLELLLYLLASFTIEVLSFAVIKRDACNPPTIFTVVDRTFTVPSLLCHDICSFADMKNRFGTDVFPAPKRLCSCLFL